MYKKLYDIDRNGLKKAQKKWKPIFQYTKTAMAGNKKHEIIRVAQENLYMLKRLSEKTSVYNVDKWNKDYQASQYYKRSHCQYPSIDFYKTQRCGSFGNVFNNVSKNETKKNFYSKTQYSKNFTNNTGGAGNSGRKRKKFEEFSYRDLQIGKRSNSENGDKYGQQQFKKLSEIESPQELDKEQEQQEEKNKEDNNFENKNEEKNEEQEQNVQKNEEEEEKKEEEKIDEGEKKEEEKNEEGRNEENTDEIKKEEENEDNNKE